MALVYLVTESGAYLVTESGAYLVARLVPPARDILLSWSAMTPILKWAQLVPTQQNWSMFIGEDVTATVFPETPSGPITGWTIAVTVKNGFGVVQPSLSKTAVIADGPNGVFTFSFAHADTVALQAGTYTYDVRRTDSGNVTELMIGTLTLLAPVGGP